MSKFIIRGGKPLRGAVRLGGAKNVSFKVMIASLLCEGRSRILNLAKIGDVETTRQIIESLGAKTIPCGERTVFIDPNGFSSYQIPDRFGPSSRASILFAPPLLKKFGKAIIPFPGGDKIGQRPLERHLLGFEKLGVQAKSANNHLYLEAPHGLRGTTYRFAKNTHTGTENLIMLAVCAQGITILENAAQETEIDDLILFLNHAGGNIKRLAGRKIRIIGVPKLYGQTHWVIPDANEAVSYACAALITQGDIAVEGAKSKDLIAFLKKIREVGGEYESSSWGIRFWYAGPLQATSVTTKPYPGFKTDWQPLWTTLMTQAQGVSRVIETVYEQRFGFVPELEKMGGKFAYFNPKVKNPETFYNFNYAESDPGLYHGLKIYGPVPLKGAHLKTDDLRHGATLTLAALAAKGETIIENAEIIDRGYETLDLKLKELGGNIKRI